MATPLKDVYKIFLAEVESIKLAKLDEDIFYDTLFSYIEKTATLDFIECKKDLSLMVADRKYSQLLETDGQTTEFKINELPPIEGIEIVLEIDGNKKENDWEIQGDTLIVAVPPTAFQDTYVKWKVEGHFEEDLDRIEKVILAKGMVLYWIDNHILREECLETTIGDRDILKTSNANMLGKLLDLRAHLRKELRSYKKRYSYSFKVEDFC